MHVSARAYKLCIDRAHLRCTSCTLRTTFSSNRWLSDPTRANTHTQFKQTTNTSAFEAYRTKYKTLIIQTYTCSLLPKVPRGTADVRRTELPT